MKDSGSTTLSNFGEDNLGSGFSSDIGIYFKIRRNYLRIRISTEIKLTVVPVKINVASGWPTKLWITRNP